MTRTILSLKETLFMVRKFLLLLVFSITCAVTYAQTSIYGKVTDGETGEELIGAEIVVEKNGVEVTGTVTDLDGNFKMNIDPGTYDITCFYVGYTDQRVEGVRVLAGKSNPLDFKINQGGIIMEEAEVIAYVVPLVEKDNTTQGQTITSKEIRQLPTRNINALASTTAGLSSIDEGSEITVRGSRSNATNYFLDGIRVFGSLPPETEIDQLQVITGGIGAQYGDVTGGIISITSKGPSSRFAGGIDFETSGIDFGGSNPILTGQYLGPNLDQNVSINSLGNINDNYVGLDPYGQSLIGVNLSGPLLKDSNGKSLIGFRLSGRYTNQRDDSPAATGVYVVKDEVVNGLITNPMVPSADGLPRPAAENLTRDDVVLSNVRPNEGSQRIDLTAKLDARLADNIDISFTGTYADAQNQFTPGGWRLINSHNNPTTYSSRARGILRLRQRFGSRNGAEASNDVIRNFEYTLSVGYEQGRSETYDPRHEDRLFNYGYVGNFDRRAIPSVRVESSSAALPGAIPFIDTLQNDTGYIAHVDYNQGVYFGYTPNADINPGLAAYNKLQDPDPDFGGYDRFTARNGDFGPNSSSVWGLYTNVSQVYNGYSKSQSDILTGNVNLSFDLYPGGSNQGAHSISLGFLYESRTLRGYSINPQRLWILARQKQNEHILSGAVDVNNTVGSINLFGEDGASAFQFANNSDFQALAGLFNSNLTSIPLYDLITSGGNDQLFYKRLRQEIGVGENNFVNIDGLDPNQLSLDMFAPKELTDFENGIIDFYGYDYLGNTVSGDATFEDFFTERATDGNNSYRTMPVAALRPTYIAGYIQDKFTYKDLIFRIGVRVDRFDNNTQVLKDNFSLYDIIGASDFNNRFGVSSPGTIGEDFKVYVDDPDAETPNVVAYRNGEQWYTPNGTQVNDPRLIFGQQGIIQPYYQEQDRSRRNIQSENFDPIISFTDYEVQYNVMPRLAFSFPISDVANFFAHYDILVQRPTGQTTFTPLNYFYFTDPGRATVKNNPNLKPERTIDYEVGFQQKLSNSSAIKIAAYYREMRDMIQTRLFQFLPSDQISEYQSFDNLDFGTVKGFTFQYDLRRTNNLQLTANYTLQFADGTGSNPTSSSRALSLVGNLRTLFPLDFDERHRLNLVMDYRYGSGKKYNGPRILGKEIFANAGLNLQTVFVSGRPYSTTNVPQPFGGTEIRGTFNGARLPWNSTLNLRVDKDFNLTKPDAARQLSLNLYIRVQNLLDTRNIIGVYSATGSPDDDGYLASPLGRGQLNDFINDGRNVESYVQAYNWLMLAPGFFTLPRRIFVGGLIQF